MNTSGNKVKTMPVNNKQILTVFLARERKCKTAKRDGDRQTGGNRK